MAKANKKSLDAKAYINGKVSEMREKRKKTTDESARKNLIETFRETTASDEYQEKLKIVHEDTKFLRGRYYGNISLEKRKEEFYWKIRTYLTDKELTEFEKMDMDEKLDFLCDRFWWWDESYSMIVDMLSCRDFVDSYIDPKDNSHILHYDKYFNMAVDRLKKMQHWMENTWNKKLKLSLKSLGGDYIYPQILVDISNYHRMSTEGFILALLSNPSIFSDDIDSILACVIHAIVQAKSSTERNRSTSYNIIDTISEWEKYFWEYWIKNYEKYHKILANKIIDYCGWKTDFLEKHINSFTWLTDKEKTEILWRSIEKEK